MTHLKFKPVMAPLVTWASVSIFSGVPLKKKKKWTEHAAKFI